jgi:hypothetical protein
MKRSWQEKLWRKIYLFSMDKYIAYKRKRNAPDEVFVTDHAILRYLERVEHVDVAAVKQKLLEGNDKMHIVMAGKTIKTMWAKRGSTKPKHTLSMKNQNKLLAIKEQL